MSIKEIIDFGTCLKYIRKENNLTQKEFAEKLGIKTSAYSNYEKNYRTPTSKVLLSIKEVFGYDIMQALNQNISIDKTNLNLKSNEQKFLDVLADTIKVHYKQEVFLSDKDKDFLYKQYRNMLDNFIEYKEINLK